MSATYTYDPSDLKGKTVSRARFELGDVLVDGGAETAMLCDEEIQAIIDDSPRWKTALYRLAEGVCMRLSLETDWKDDGASFNLDQRAKRWMELKDRFKKEADALASLPSASSVLESVRNPEDGGHYFYGGMMQNPNVKPPMPFQGGGK